MLFVTRLMRIVTTICIIFNVSIVITTECLTRCDLPNNDENKNLYYSTVY